MDFETLLKCQGKFYFVSTIGSLSRLSVRWHLGLYLNILWTDTWKPDILEQGNLQVHNLNNFSVFCSPCQVCRKKRFQSKNIYHYFKIMSRSSLKLLSHTSFCVLQRIQVAKIEQNKKTNPLFLIWKILEITLYIKKWKL